MKLLVVDDEQFAIQGILDSVMWEKTGIDKVATANSGTEAKALLLAEHFDLLLCDIEMPFGSGIELVEWIRQEKLEILCIFLTGHSDFDYAQSAVRMQCFDYLLKPAAPEKITEVLLRAIDQLQQTHKAAEYRKYGELYVKNMAGDGEADPAGTEDIVDQCVAYIREHIADTLTVDELAGQLYISAGYLARLFRKKFDQSPMDYVKDQRMFLAREMLENTDLSITMVSAKVGYSNFSYFITCFKKYYGVTPRDYKQAFLKSKQE